jgi:hypothetical protein
MAAIRFALARALIRTDRARAGELARAARDGFATLGAPGTTRATAVTRWAAGQGLPR